MREPHWIEKRALLFLHSTSVAEHGGKEGIRDEGLLESPLTRARNKFHYEPDCTIFDLAGAYAFGLARNHPFNDGNKRAAFLAIGLFLARNGHELVADQVDAIQVMLKLAAGKMTERKLTGWIKENARRKEPTE